MSIDALEKEIHILKALKKEWNTLESSQTKQEEVQLFQE